jgi:hypothetical protein
MYPECTPLDVATVTFEDLQLNIKLHGDVTCMVGY